MSLLDIEIQAHEQSDIDCDNYGELNSLLAKDDFIEKRCGEIFMSHCKILIFLCTECKEHFACYEEFFNHLCEHHVSMDEIKSEPKDEEHLLDAEYYDVDNLIVVMDESEDNVKSTVRTSMSPNNLTIEKDVTSQDEISQDYEVVVHDDDVPEITAEDLQQCYDDFEELDAATVDSIEDGKQVTFLNDFSKFLEKDYRVIEECNLQQSNSTQSTEALNSIKEDPIELDSLKKDNRLTCQMCNRVFDTKQKLQTHAKTHGKARRFKCHICGYAFTEQFNLRSHLKRHNGAKLFPCDQCEKKFITKNELNAHVRIHTGERPFVCEICGNCFVTSGSLNEHRKRHLNFRPHKCSVCEKSFFDTGLLKEHMVVHTGERTHFCDKCQAGFTRRKALLQHMKLHSDVKQYKCMYCEKAFAQKPGLASHLKTHRKMNSGDGESLTIDCE